MLLLKPEDRKKLINAGLVIVEPCVDVENHFIAKQYDEDNPDGKVITTFPFMSERENYIAKRSQEPNTIVLK